jgi:hypothetical protein
MDGDDIRNPDGTFKEGAKGNPEGNNGHLRGYQRYGDRAAFLLGKYTVKELLEIASDPGKLGDQPFYDGMIISHLARVLQSDEMGQERERLLNRIEGKPKQTVDLSMKGDLALHGLSESELRKRLMDKLGKLNLAGDAGDAAAAGGTGEAPATDPSAGVPAAVETKPV